ncbi:MAG TPA: PDDEXK nuclease domain-containing protein, partial [Chitinophagales bacterium]|nr:PDDEXK nuclease domain-containing protein [Chitinophagales bacterium]
MNNPESEALFVQIKAVLDEARTKISRVVNSTVVQTYWSVGKYIVEHKQKGAQRAEYGKHLIKDLSERLVTEYGNGFNITNLKYMRLFYLCFPIGDAVRDQLSWTHYRAILKVQNEKAREFYINECISENWSTRQLERQINTLFYERLLASTDKETVRNEIKHKEPYTLQPREIIRDPYILEFIGIPQGEHFMESDLEKMLISKLQHFLLEMGKGFSFVARQKRISFDNQHFYIDLVFYNYLARCFVLIDLKADHLTHADLGQMQMY